MDIACFPHIYLYNSKDLLLTTWIVSLTISNCYLEILDNERLQ